MFSGDNTQTKDNQNPKAPTSAMQPITNPMFDKIPTTVQEPEKKQTNIESNGDKKDNKKEKTNQSTRTNENSNDEDIKNKQSTGGNNNNFYFGNKEDKEKYEKRKNEDPIFDRVLDAPLYPLEENKRKQQLVHQLKKIKNPLGEIKKDLAKTIGDELKKIDDEYDKKIKELNKKKDETKPLDKHYKTKSEEYEMFLSKIINRFSFKDGKVYTNLADFLQNIDDLQKYAKQLSDTLDEDKKQEKEKQMASEIKKELTRMINYLNQTSENIVSVGKLDEIKKSAKLLTYNYNHEYNTRNLATIFVDYIKNFFLSFFGLYSIEYTRNKYNEIFPKIIANVSKLNSKDIEEASLAREELISNMHQLENAVTYSIDSKIDINTYNKIDAVVKEVVNESTNIDNTDLFKHLLKIGGKFDIENICNHPGQEERQNLKDGIIDFLNTNIFPDCQKKSEQIEKFITGGKPDEENLSDDEKKQINEIFDGNLGTNAKNFSIKTYKEDMYDIETKIQAYENCATLDKIDKLQEIYSQSVGNYLSKLKEQQTSCNEIITQLNGIQQHTGITCSDAGDIIESVKKSLEPKQSKLKDYILLELDKISGYIDSDTNYDKLKKRLSTSLKRTTDDEGNVKNGKQEDFELLKKFENDCESIKSKKDKIKEKIDKEIEKTQDFTNTFNNNFNKLNIEQNDERRISLNEKLLENYQQYNIKEILQTRNNKKLEKGDQTFKFYPNASPESNNQPNPNDSNNQRQNANPQQNNQNQNNPIIPNRNNLFPFTSNNANNPQYTSPQTASNIPNNNNNYQRYSNINNDPPFLPGQQQNTQLLPGQQS